MQTHVDSKFINNVDFSWENGEPLFRNRCYIILSTFFISQGPMLSTESLTGWVVMDILRKESLLGWVLRDIFKNGVLFSDGT